MNLALLDVTMPRMTGYQACRLPKTEPQTQDLPVIILTSRDQAGDPFWGVETGADYYVTKDAERVKVGRYGGEEFVIILPHTSPEEARATGERIRRKVASYPTPTVDSSESLLREADAALYRAKEAGRNRVE